MPDIVKVVLEKGDTIRAKLQELAITVAINTGEMPKVSGLKLDMIAVPVTTGWTPMNAAPIIIKATKG